MLNFHSFMHSFICHVVSNYYVRGMRDTEISKIHTLTLNDFMSQKEIKTESAIIKCTQDSMVEQVESREAGRKQLKSQSKILSHLI